MSRLLLLNLRISPHCDLQNHLSKYLTKKHIRKIMAGKLPLKIPYYLLIHLLHRSLQHFNLSFSNEFTE